MAKVKPQSIQEKELKSRIAILGSCNFSYVGLKDPLKHWGVKNSIYDFSIESKKYENKTFNEMVNEFIRVGKRKKLDLRIKTYNRKSKIETSVKIKVNSTNKSKVLDKYDRYYVLVMEHKRSKTLFLKQGKFSSLSNSERITYDLRKVFSPEDFKMYPPCVLETEYASEFEDIINSIIDSENKAQERCGEISLSKIICINDFRKEKAEISFIKTICREASTFKHFSKKDIVMLDTLRSFLY